jgi:ribonuclease HII
MAKQPPSIVLTIHSMFVLFVILPFTATVHAFSQTAVIPPPWRRRRQIMSSCPGRPQHAREELGPEKGGASPPALTTSSRQKKKRKSLEALLEVESDLRARGYSYVIGCDDTGGAGCIAGPIVVASCCLLKPFSSFLPVVSSPPPSSSSGCLVSQSAMRSLIDVNDCKGLTPAQRREIYDAVHSYPDIFAVSIAQRSPRQIDEGNLARATQSAFAESIETLVDNYGLPFEKSYAIVDGKVSPKLYSNRRTHEESEAVDLQATQNTFSVRPYVDGDAHVYTVAMASILARVERDKMMEDLHRQHPLYGFDQHFGFGRRDHIEAIHRLGAIEGVHRMSFKQVKGR